MSTDCQKPFFLVKWLSKPLHLQFLLTIILLCSTSTDKSFYLEHKKFWWWSLLILCLWSEAFLHKLHALWGLHLTENVFCGHSWLSIQVHVAGECRIHLTLNALIGCVCFSNWNGCAHVFIMCFAVGVNVSDMWVVFGSVAVSECFPEKRKSWF